MDSMIHAIVDCALPSFLWNIFAIMISDIAMNLTLDDCFKILGVINIADKNKSFSKAQKTVALSLACLIGSILYTEYYRRNPSPNTQVILNKLQHELNTLKAKNAFMKNWLNNTLSKSDIIFQKIRVPTDFSYIRSLEQSH